MAVTYETPTGEVIHIPGPRWIHNESDETLRDALAENREFLASVPQGERHFRCMPSAWEVARGLVTIIEREMRRRGICQE